MSFAHAATSKLEAAREAFSILREVKDYGIYVMDPDGLILTWNDGAETIKGYSAEEIIGHSFSRFFTAADRANGKPARLLARAAAEGRVEDEAHRVRKDGTVFWADVVITAIHDPATGQLLGFAKVTRDLTERRLADERLRQSEERLRLLIEGVKDYAVYMLDAGGIVTTWNSGAERIKGYTAREVIGQHFSLFYVPEMRGSGLPQRELDIASSEGRYEEEGWRVRKNGERFWANIVLTAIHDPGTGELRGFAKVTRDLTERRRMEEDARSAEVEAGLARARANEAQIALQARDEFISVAAHELRTPLTALVLKLQGAMQALRKIGVALPDVEVEKLSTRIGGGLRQVDRLADLVERLLDVSRIVRGHLVLQPATVDLAEVVRHVMDDFGEAAQSTGSVLRVRASDNVIGQWDHARLEQVVVNLLSNAIKYGGGKPIDIELQSTELAARLVVTDHGIGIEAADIERIFARFERAASATHYGGLGLGLYIAKNIVEAHGGSIRVSSQPGDGATFVAELPRAHALSAPVQHQKPAQP